MTVASFGNDALDGKTALIKSFLSTRLTFSFGLFPVPSINVMFLITCTVCEEEERLMALARIKSMRTDDFMGCLFCRTIKFEIFYDKNQ
jgi:hypothetical protein